MAGDYRLSRSVNFHISKKMDENVFSGVSVFNLDNAGKLVERYPSAQSQLVCSYDPAGMSVRVVPGECDL